MLIDTGYHMNLDFRTMEPKPFMELFPALIDISEVRHQVQIGDDLINISAPQKTADYSVLRPSYETASPLPLEEFGPTSRAPLGSIVHARSGDKANNSNVGFFVRHEDEYPWLQSLLTIDRFKSLLEDDWETGNTDRRIERCEFPNIWAVHL